MRSSKVDSVIRQLCFYLVHKLLTKYIVKTLLLLLVENFRATKSLLITESTVQCTYILLL